MTLRMWGLFVHFICRKKHKQYIKYGHRGFNPYVSVFSDECITFIVFDNSLYSVSVDNDLHTSSTLQETSNQTTTVMTFTDCTE